MLPSPVYVVLRWLIVLSSFAFLLWKISSSDLGAYKEQVIAVGSDLRFPLLVMFSLLNWGLESLKWRKSLDGVIMLSKGDAFSATLAGCSVSFVSPNRTGEFLGRMYWLPQEKAGFAIPSSVYCSMNQLFVTLITGSAMLFFRTDILTDHHLRNLLFLVSFLLILLVLVLLFRMNWVVAWVKAFLLKRGILPYLNFLLEMKRSIKLNVFALSVLRYLVFALQFALLLHWLGALSWWEAFSGVAVLFFLQTLLPSMAFAEIGVRGTLAVLVFSGLCSDEILLFSTVLIWVLNLAIPALAGAFLLAFKS